MKYCHVCKRYALTSQCSVCKGVTINKEPPRFSPQDKYGKYRRMLKRRTKNEKH